jgi:hypothetical protein
MVVKASLASPEAYKYIIAAIHHRSERWIVVNGMAKVVDGDCNFFMNINESNLHPDWPQAPARKPWIN